MRRVCDRLPDGFACIQSTSDVVSFWKELAEWFNPPEPEPVVFKPEWVAVLRENVPIYERLPEELKGRLHEKIVRFVQHKQFEGCGGLELTDDMVLTIAGQACLLGVMHAGDAFPKLRTVLVYPSAYRTTSTHIDGAGVVHQGETVRLGESWSNGTVILAWDAVRQGAKNCFDGHNVTLHEFAHQLDQADGRGDGTPRLPDAPRYAQWAQVLETERTLLDRMAEAGRRTVLDTYGTTNAAEFFAVATEAFFEKPRQLARKQPELYLMLKDYFGLDPAPWFTKG